MFEEAKDALAKIAVEAQVAARQWGVPVTIELVVTPHGIMGRMRAPDGELFGETETYPI